MSIQNTRKELSPRRFTASKASGTAVVAGNLYALSGTNIALATNANLVAGNAFIADKAITAGEAATECQLLAFGEVFICDTLNNSNSAHNGQAMDLHTTADRLANTGTTSANGRFIQLAVIGAAADRKVLATKVI